MLSSSKASPIRRSTCSSRTGRSKNPTAVAASGKERPRIVEAERFKGLVKRRGQAYKESVPIQMFGETGTTEQVVSLNLRRMYPTRNFREGHFEDYEAVSADALYENYVEKRVTCHGCSVRCRRAAKIDSGPYAGV